MVCTVQYALVNLGFL